MKRLKPIFHRRRPECGPDLHRTRDSLELLVTKITQLEQIAQKSSGGVSNHDDIRFGEPLEPGREVGGFTDNASLLGLAGSDEIADHHQPRGNSDARLQPRIRLQFCHCGDKVQGRPYGPLGIVLMSLRVAEMTSTPSPMHFATNPP